MYGLLFLMNTKLKVVLVLQAAPIYVVLAVMFGQCGLIAILFTFLSLYKAAKRIGPTLRFDITTSFRLLIRRDFKII